MNGGTGTGMRIFGLDKVAISDNTISNTINDNIKIHGFTWTGANYTQNIVVSDNKLMGG